MGYAFYMVTKKDYTYEALSGLTASKRQMKLYKSKGLDISKYNALKIEIEDIELDLESFKKLFPEVKAPEYQVANQNH